MTKLVARWLFRLVLVSLFIAGCWAAWARWYDGAFPTCTIRYKLAVDVSTPQGIKSGSSVYEVSYSHGATFGGPPQGYFSIRGEAVYVDLGMGKNLFATLSNEQSGRTGLDRTIRDLGDRNGPFPTGSLNAFEMPVRAFGLVWKPGQEPALCKEFDALPPNTSVKMPIERLPTLVTFANLDDPNSLQVITPDSLPDVLGGDYHLTAATVSKTQAEPAKPDEQPLKWLEGMRQQDKNSSINSWDALVKTLFVDIYRRYSL